MKRIILFLIACNMLFTLASFAHALPADYFLLETIDISAHLTNPQALEVIPGGFLVVDRASAATSFVFILDGQGNLMNETNNTIVAKINLTKNASLSALITGIRVYNFTSADEFSYAVLDDSGKNITMVNSSDFTRVGGTFVLPTGAFSSTDSLAGFCTNKSDFWVAIADRDVITNFGGGGNNSVNQSEFAIPGTNSAGGIDCFQGNNSELIILDDTTGIVYHTTKSKVLDFINLSSLTSQGLNTFSDIAFLTDPATHRPDFYALNNATNLIYHINKRTSDVLNIFEPTISFTYPANQQSFNSRFSSVLIQFNFSAQQANNSRSQFDLTSDVLNCTLFVNDTANSSVTNTVSNISINSSINVTFEEGSFKTDIRCFANNTYSKQGISKFHTISMSTFRHVFWMGDNFTIYYDSDNNNFQVALGINQTELSAPFNITAGRHVNLRVTWDNSTGNRTLYIEGLQVASDTFYEWSMDRLDRIYLGSRNDTGQVNGIISYLQISNAAEASKFNRGSFITTWKDTLLNIIDRITSSYFFQFKAVLKRSLTSEKPTLRFVNISFDDTLMNFSIEPDVDFLDFSFSSGDSDALPAGQTASTPIFTIWNIGNKSFDLQANSLTPFSSCFTAGLFNATDDGLRLGDVNNTINLSTTLQTIETILPGGKVNVWMNVTTSGCTPSSEFFDIEFTTSP